MSFRGFSYRLIDRDLREEAMLLELGIAVIYMLNKQLPGKKGGRLHRKSKESQGTRKRTLKLWPASTRKKRPSRLNRMHGDS